MSGPSLPVKGNINIACLNPRSVSIEELFGHFGMCIILYLRSFLLCIVFGGREGWGGGLDHNYHFGLTRNLDKHTAEWDDGLVPLVFRKMVSSQNSAEWLVFDGPVR
jgi:hypothetical protein